MQPPRQLLQAPGRLALLVGACPRGEILEHALAVARRAPLRGAEHGLLARSAHRALLDGQRAGEAGAERAELRQLRPGDALATGLQPARGVLLFVGFQLLLLLLAPVQLAVGLRQALARAAFGELHQLHQCLQALGTLHGALPWASAAGRRMRRAAGDAARASAPAPLNSASSCATLASKATCSSSACCR